MDNLMTNSLTGKVASKAADSAVGKDTWCPEMSFKIRMICFLALYVFGKCRFLFHLTFFSYSGLILAFIGCIGLNPDDPEYSIMRWFIPYIFGFLLAIGGTLFFQGIVAQGKEILSKERRFATITWASCLLLLVIFGFATKSSTLCVILCLC